MLQGYWLGMCVSAAVALRKDEGRIALVKSKPEKWMLHQQRCEMMRKRARFLLGDYITFHKINDAERKDGCTKGRALKPQKLKEGYRRPPSWRDGKETRRGDKKSVVACIESDGKAKIKEEEEGGALQSDLEQIIKDLPVNTLQTPVPREIWTPKVYNFHVLGSHVWSRKGYSQPGRISKHLQRKQHPWLRAVTVQERRKGGMRSRLFPAAQCRKEGAMGSSARGQEQQQ